MSLGVDDGGPVAERRSPGTSEQAMPAPSGAPRTSAFRSPDWPNTRECVADRLRRVVLKPEENEHGHADRVGQL